MDKTPPLLPPDEPVNAARNDLVGAARRGVRWTMLGAVGSSSLQLIQIALLARLLAPDDFGYMAILLVIITIGTTVSELGLSSAIIQRREVSRDAMATLYLCNIGAGAGLFVLLWVTAPAISELIDQGEISHLIRGAAAVFLISPWGVQFRALLHKNLDFGLLTGLNLAALAVGAVTAVSLASMQFGPWALLGGYLASETVLTAMLIITGIRRRLWPGLAWNFGAARGYLSFGGFRMAAMFTNSVNMRLDQLIIGTSMGANSLGIYHVAHRIAIEPVQKINPVITRVAFPVFALVQNEPARLQRGYLRMVELLLGVNAPILLGLAATAHLLVPLVLGTEWEGAVPIVQVMTVYALLRSLGNASWALVLAMGRADWNFYWDMAKLLIVPATVLFVAIKTQDLTSIAWSLVALQVIFLIALYFLVIRRLIGRFGGIFLLGSLRPVLTALIMAVSMRLLDALASEMPDLLRLTLIVSVGVVAYVALSLAIQPALLREIIRTVVLPVTSRKQASAP